MPFKRSRNNTITSEAEMERPREFVREGPRTREMEEREVKVEC